MGIERGWKRVIDGVRIFRREDADSLEAISDESPEAANWSKESYLKFAEENGSLALVIDSGEEVSGFFVGRLIGDQAEVLNLAVRPNHRRRREASALLGAALKAFRSKGTKSVYLEVRESNTGAIAFYEKHGFAKTGLRERYYRQPVEAAVIMELKLAG